MATSEQHDQTIPARTQLVRRCPTCDGTGSVGTWHDWGRSADYDAGPCDACEGSGKAPAVCEGWVADTPCGQPAFHQLGCDYLCDRCAGLCSLCDESAPEDDRLPWGSHGAVVHTECALFFSARPAVRRRFLEITDITVEAAGGDARARARAHEDNGGATMPAPAETLLETQRREGFISTKEAVRLSGHALSTIYDWIAQGRFKQVRRSGIFHFVRLEELEALCPHIRRAS